MSEIDELAEELFGDSDERGEFRQVRPERCKEMRETDWRSDPDYGDPMSLDQWERTIESDEIHHSLPNGWRGRDNRSMVEDLRAVLDEFPHAEIRLGGSLDEAHTWVDTVWIHYEQPNSMWEDDFEEFAVLRFKSSLPDETKGVCPVCDDRVDTANEYFRYPESDPSLWATTDEFDFRRNDEWGPYLRMWWDD